ncbi:M14 family metallopeptidase [Winogradskyella poriferorum]|uniref:M14 family metallopeptidase n=1 Tax=Winogradskyella poriferorum TaxID=307627 RepID=UPI003D646373
MNIKDLINNYSKIKEARLHGRYITNQSIESCLKDLEFNYEVIGRSVEERPIYGIQLGQGKNRVLMWSQMHGNESTTTKSIFDFFKVLKYDKEFSDFILEKCTLYIIPILNPDGAYNYTRLNANKIDLNRDAQDLSQPESRVLNTIFEAFNPHFCFNLHGQRTIFGVGESGKSSSISFLAPAQDEERSITNNRKIAMTIVADMYSTLNEYLIGHIGRYDDAFNINCVGDTFQSKGIPTILFEAGHINGDYNREEVRKYILVAMLKALTSISKFNNKSCDYSTYNNILNNSKSFYDIIIRNALINSNDKHSVDIAIQYDEVLIDEKIEFIPRIKAIANLSSFYGHVEIEAGRKVVKSSSGSVLKVTNEIDFVLLNNEKIALKP